MAIRITVWLEGLFSRFVTTGRHGKWFTDMLILIRQMTALTRRVLAEVCTVSVRLIAYGGELYYDYVEKVHRLRHFDADTS